LKATYAMSDTVATVKISIVLTGLKQCREKVKLSLCATQSYIVCARTRGYRHTVPLILNLVTRRRFKHTASPDYYLQVLPQTSTFLL
jgi:hypothetical protein